MAPRTGSRMLGRLREKGIIGVKIEGDDQLLSAALTDGTREFLIATKQGQSIRFRADDTQLRPMGRATSGVTGMKFREGDSVLSMSVIRAEQVHTVHVATLAFEFCRTMPTAELAGLRAEA